LILVAVIHIALFRTRWGLRTRACGEHPRAADTVGIPVNRFRYINTMLGGALAGLAGGFLVLEAVGQAIAWWETHCDLLVVEGTGGFYCPLAEGTTVADLAVALDFPLVVVARRGLGTLNHTLMTVELARWRALRVAGIVLNSSELPSPEDGLAESTNADELSRRLPGVPILAELGHGGDADLADLLADVDFAGLARRARHDAVSLAQPKAGR
jgi:hypothetical protein